DVQPLRGRRPVGGDGAARHPPEELSFHVSEVDDRDDQAVQSEHEGRYPRHPAPQGPRRRVLQVALQHANPRRSRVREGRQRTHQEALDSLRRRAIATTRFPPERVFLVRLAPPSEVAKTPPQPYYRHMRDTAPVLGCRTCTAPKGTTTS